MATNPGGKDREQALYTYIREHFPPFAEWAERRARYFDALQHLAQKRYPRRQLTPEQRSDRLLLSQVTRENVATDRRKKAWLNRKHREWDKAHPNPLTSEKRRELEAAFSAQHGPTGRS